MAAPLAKRALSPVARSEKTHAHGQHQVRLVQREGGGVVPVHALHAEVARVVRIDGGQAHERAADGRVQPFGRLQDQIGQAGRDHAAAHVHIRPLALLQQLHRLVHRRLRRLLLPERLRHGPVLKLARGDLHVLGDVDEHRARPAGARDAERFADHVGKPGHVVDKIVVLGDVQRDAGDVHLLERVAPDLLERHVPRDGDQRHRVEHGRSDARDQVRRARAGRGDDHAHLARGAGVAVGRVRGALLMRGEHMADAVAVFIERVVNAQHLAAGVAEHVGHALLDQGLQDDLSACFLHGFAPFRTGLRRRTAARRARRACG